MMQKYVINENFDDWYAKHGEIYQLDRRVTYLESIIRELNLEKKHECPVCGERILEFAPFGGLLYEKEQCPSCGSVSRHRSLYLLMKKELKILEQKNISILHFAPEPALYQLFHKKEGVNYITADLDKSHYRKELMFFCAGKTLEYFYHPENFIQKEINVEEIPYVDNSFDYVIINHVLEHVEKDKKAMSELYRVLKPNGTALITVPVKGEITNEDESINTSELRLKFYNDPTHLREYGKDIVQRLESFGFKVRAYENKDYFSQEERFLYGIHESEITYLCKKFDIS